METKRSAMERKWKNSREMKDSQHFPHFKVQKSSKTIQGFAPCDSLITPFPPESEASENKSRDGHKGRKGIGLAKNLGTRKGSKALLNNP